MNFKLILITTLIVQTAGADEPVDCSSMLARVSPKVVASSSSRPLFHIFNTVNYNNLNGRELAILAKAADFSERQDASNISELEALGVPKQDILSFVKPYIDKDLRKMESATASISVPSPALVPAPQDSGLLTYQGQAEVPEKVKHNPFKKLVDKYQLQPTIDFIGEINSSRVDEVDAEYIMTQAFATEDPEFIKRAIKIGFKSANFNKLILLASEAKHNTTLVILGKIGISRYILHQNQNWLLQGLSAFSLVTGNEKEKVSEFLYDLSDLLRSPMVLSENENYLDHSTLVLMATQKTASSSPFDSSDRLKHVYSPTSDIRFKNRVQSIINEIIHRKMSIGLVREVVSMVNDRNFQLAVAEQALTYSEFVPNDERYQILHLKWSLALYVQSILMSGDEELILQHMRNAVEKKQANSDSRLQPIDGYLINLPNHVLELLERVRQNPAIVGASTSADIIGIDRFLDSLTPKEEMKFKSMFWHVRSVIEGPMKEGNILTAAQVEEKKNEAEKLIAEERLFSAIAPLTAARDSVGLRRLYELIMQNGRSLDAVYAGLAIEWIETGMSPFNDIDNSPDQIENNNRLGFQ